MSIPFKVVLQEGYTVDTMDTLQEKIKQGMLFGEFNPVRRPLKKLICIDPSAISHKVVSLDVQDRLITGELIPYGPKADLLQKVIDSKEPIVVRNRGYSVSELKKEIIFTFDIFTLAVFETYDS